MADVPKFTWQGLGKNCPCGEEWIGWYWGGDLYMVRCGRGHEPIDFLTRAMVAIPENETRLVSARGPRSSFIERLIAQAQVQPPPTPIEWRFWDQDQEGKPWQAEEDRSHQERSQDSCQQAADHEEVEEPEDPQASYVRVERP